MKEKFKEYYPLEQHDFDKLWKKATIVVDTNVLLDLYRFPASAREDFLSTINNFNQRLWIPYHVALEFQRRRLTVISAERKATEKALDSARQQISELKAKVDSLQIDKHNIGIEAQPLIENLENANSKIIEAISAVHKAQPDIAASDPIRARLDEMFRGKVGPGPKDQEHLNQLLKDADWRYSEKIPPGFADIEKERAQSEPSFVHNHIKYEKKYGDLIIWKQIINHAKESKIKEIIFVTQDSKDDWWWREYGKTMGPHPELVREIFRETEVVQFWMYSSAQFLDNAGKHTNLKISDQSVNEIKQVSLSPLPASSSFEEADKLPLNETRGFSRRVLGAGFEYEDIEYAIRSWLERSLGDRLINAAGFPSLIFNTENGLHGYEIKMVRKIERILSRGVIAEAALLGKSEVSLGNLALFSIVVVVDEDEARDEKDSERWEKLANYSRRLVKDVGITSILIGYVRGIRFIPLFEWGNNN